MFEVSKGPGPVSICHNRMPLVFKAETLPSSVLTSTNLKKQ